MALYLPDQRQGDTWRIKIDYSLDSKGKPLTTPPDITGFKFWFTLKNTYSDIDNTVLQHSTVAGDYVGDDAANGIAYLIIPHTSTKDIDVGEYYYDLQAQDTNGEVTTLIPPADRDFYEDKLFIAPQVTQAYD